MSAGAGRAAPWLCPPALPNADANSIRSLSTPQTIIECLKQACTGELPPNCRSGHSFIHDPKASRLGTLICMFSPVHLSDDPLRRVSGPRGLLHPVMVLLCVSQISGDHEVRGQVKLKIIGTQGVPVVVTRSFMAKQTQKTLQFKSLDASLTTRCGHCSSHSARCHPRAPRSLRRLRCRRPQQGGD